MQHRLLFNRISDKKGKEIVDTLSGSNDDKMSLRSKKRTQSHPLRRGQMKLKGYGNSAGGSCSSNNNSPLRSRGSPPPKKAMVTFEDDPHQLEPTAFGQPPQMIQ